MGERIPIFFAKGPEAQFTANVIAAYFGEQMGREINLIPGANVQSCLDMLRYGKGPIAILDGRPDKDGSVGITVVDPVLIVGGKVMMLVMEEGAERQLQFSLVPMYMRKLEDGLSVGDWETGLARIRAGEGIRKVALDMLRGKDLI